MQIVKYLREVKNELAKVSWPTREVATRMTAIVVAASVVVALYIGGLDLAFASLLGLFI